MRNRVDLTEILKNEANIMVELGYEQVEAEYAACRLQIENNILEVAETGLVDFKDLYHILFDFMSKIRIKEIQQ